MLVRVSHYQTPVSKVADAEKWAVESAIPRVRKQGALHGYWAADRRTGKSVVVTFWRDEAAANGSWKDSGIRDDADSLFGAKMTSVEMYEVFGQI
jgi:hypothetical protein